MPARIRDWVSQVATLHFNDKAAEVCGEIRALLGSQGWPIGLIQSEPRRTGHDTLDFDGVRTELMTHHGIAAKEIVVATGEEIGMEKIDADYRLGISDPACPVNFVITQKALAKGWDCPFAYISVSMNSPAGLCPQSRRWPSLWAHAFRKHFMAAVVDGQKAGESPQHAWRMKVKS